MRLQRLAFVAILLFSVPGITLGETIEISPSDDWFSILSGDSLQPGDEVVLGSGIYSNSRRLVICHSGTLEEPVTIRAAAGASVVFKRPDAKQNTINLEGNQHLRLIGLEITGGAAGIRISARAGRQPSDLVLEGLHIHDIGGVAITCNHEGAKYRHMTFRGNHIHHTSGHGEAFYLGGNRGSAIISESVIENNYIHDLNGVNVSQGDGIEIKQGSYGNRIVGNVIHDTKYPGITVYGTADHARNVIENNWIWNTGDHGIQAAADAIIRDNKIASVAGCGIYSREHQGAVPANLRIEGNFVIGGTNPALRIIGGQTEQADATIELVGNRLCARNGFAIRIDDHALVKGHQNRGTGKVAGRDHHTLDWSVDDSAKVGPLSELKGHPLKGHPAWRSMDRHALRNLFVPR
ncbi:MAG: right-handed parallel beta-helix repeat-containing protein [Rubripirellula sp.]